MFMYTITLFTLGTETDVHYLLALGAQLQKQGLHVCLAAASVFQPLARKLGLSFQALAADFESKNFTQLDIEEQQYRGLLQQVQQLAENSNLMAVHNPYLPIIRALGPLPCQVMAVALRAEEVFFCFNQPQGLLQRIACWLKRSKRIEPYLPTLYNFSPRLMAGQEEQANHLHLSGQWAIPDSLQWTFSGRGPSPALCDWMYRGGRPVFFDFSQAPESDREHLLNMVKELSQKTGFRALICTQWATCEEGLLQRDIFCVKAPVQEWLFQQCSAVIHYRQSDKLPAAIRAGVPSILCASGTIANFWGQILTENGIGIHLRKEPPTAAALEAALEQVLRLSMQYKAKMMGKAMQEEDGLDYTANAVARQVGMERVAVAV